MYFSFIFQIFSVSPLFLIFLKLRYLSIVYGPINCYTVTISRTGWPDSPPDVGHNGTRPRPYELALHGVGLISTALISGTAQSRVR